MMKKLPSLIALAIICLTTYSILALHLNRTGEERRVRLEATEDSDKKSSAYQNAEITPAYSDWSYPIGGAAGSSTPEEVEDASFQ